MLGLRFCASAFSSCGKRGPLFIAVRGPLLLRNTGSRTAGSVIVAHGPSCLAACGIFPDQGSNPYPLHWQADSQPLCHQGSPGAIFNFIFHWKSLPQHSKIMSYSESICTIRINIAVLSLAKVQAHLTACWPEVVIGKDAASITSKGIVISYQHNISHCLLLNKNHQ